MKHNLKSNLKALVNLTAFSVLLASCSTTKFIKYEEGEIIESHKNPRFSNLPIQHEIELKTESHNGHPMLAVTIRKNEPKKEEWDTERKKIGVYETKCMGWRGGGSDAFFAQSNSTPRTDCDFDTLSFIIGHVVVLGFFFDLSLPFQSYDHAPVQSKKIESGTITQTDSQITGNRSSVSPKSVSINFNGVRSTVPTSEGVAFFDFKKIALDPVNLPPSATVTIGFDDTVLNISDRFAEFAKTDADRKTALEVEKQKPENKFKLKYCGNPDLLRIIYQSQRIELEQNCIYEIQTGPIKVIQATHGGILVGLTEGMIPYAPNRIIFIETMKQYVDDDPVSNLYVRSIGIKSYNTVLGAEKTVYAFRELK